MGFHIDFTPSHMDLVSDMDKKKLSDRQEQIMNSRHKYLEDELYATGCRFGHVVQLKVKDTWENPEKFLIYLQNNNYNQH